MSFDPTKVKQESIVLEALQFHAQHHLSERLIAQTLLDNRNLTQYLTTLV